MTDISTTAATGPSGDGSVAARIKSKHQGRRKPIELPVPRFEGDVIVQCDEASPKAIQAQARKTPVLGFADLLASCCREILLIDPTTGRKFPAREDINSSTPVKFDSRLADMFGIAGGDPTQIVMQIFGSDTAIIGAGTRLLNWSTGADLDTADSEEVEELAGEPHAAT